MSANGYKFKVNGEVENKEAQELFFKLGYIWNTGLGPKHLDSKFLYAKNGILTIGYDSDNFENSASKEIDIHQLRDLTVLRCNDVNDANYSLFVSTSQPTLDIYKTSSDKFYVYEHRHHAWTESFSVAIDTPNLKPVKKMSLEGADAKLAWANGEELQIDSGYGFYDLTGDYCLFAFDYPSNKFRLKPKTITLNGVEIPAPFEPKEGDKVWFLDDDSEFGYGGSMKYGKDIKSYFGWWSTEAKIKQVVAALRSVFKCN